MKTVFVAATLSNYELKPKPFAHRLLPLLRFPFVKSAHMTEAIAAAAGFRTNAALRAHCAGSTSSPSLRLDNLLFAEHLYAFGYRNVKPSAFSELESQTQDAFSAVATATTLSPEETTMSKLFFSYSHADEALRDRLEVHLSLMKIQGLIETWHDRGITAGSNFSEAIDENLESANVILLLVSADFLASRYCYSVEMKRALERHEERAARVIPVILEPCDWHTAPFGKLLAVPKDGKAVTTWANQAEAWTDVVRQIRKVVEVVVLDQSTSKAPPALDTELASGWGLGPQGFSPSYSVGGGMVESGQPTPERPRSSNLRLKKEFSDFDRDKFLHDTFNYIGKFFQASLEEVASRNAGVQGRFQPHGNDAFSAFIYRNGKVVSECSIWLGGLGGRSQALSFSYSANAVKGSFNEMVSIDSDSQSMYFKALGMQNYHVWQNAQLSEQGASEYFWGMFIEPLQR